MRNRTLRLQRPRTTHIVEKVHGPQGWHDAHVELAHEGDLDGVRLGHGARVVASLYGAGLFGVVVGGNVVVVVGSHLDVGVVGLFAVAWWARGAWMGHGGR